MAAQAAVYPQVLDELCGGTKRSHWMWFIFPQIAGLGHSPTARFYAIADRGEGEAYARHPLLGVRLTECTSAMLRWAGERPVEAILGQIDAMKFRSSMTLFEACAPRPQPFAAALDAYYAGHRDPATLARL